ncbi:chemosensory protein [Asbolus verrucosus]|uniref:Chemosensory protein n=1 Tax=Asbolus verrucosus TaxID=1661398 RepID=A0A482W4C7_ASBVE|nr:chemosensory protein [Asbolus verrucosus]
MKLFIVALFVAFFVIAYAAEKYTTKYDNVDLEKILKSERLLRNYVNCLLDKGRCSPDGQELKKVLPDALSTSCKKCSETQKQGTKRIIQYLIKNKRNWWDQLEAKYDPTGSYRIQYEKELKEQGIQLTN